MKSEWWAVIGIIGGKLPDFAMMHSFRCDDEDEANVIALELVAKGSLDTNVSIWHCTTGDGMNIDVVSC